MLTLDPPPLDGMRFGLAAGTIGMSMFEAPPEPVFGKLEDLIAQMCRLQQDEVFGQVPIGVPRWDVDLWHAGRAWLERQRDITLHDAGFASEAVGDVYLATQLYTMGGHTPLIGDLIRSLPGPASVVVTDIGGEHGGALSADILARLGVGCESVTVLTGASLDERLRRLMARLGQLRARRMFLFHHPHDPLPCVAAQPQLAAERWLVHHADGIPSFGLHLPGVRLIDLHERAAAMSRLLGRRPWLLPLTASDPGPRSVPFLSRGRLVTASSGGAHKFEGRRVYGYAETLGMVLRTTGGWHVHIGPLTPSTLDEIARALSDAGVAQDRFVHVLSTASLAMTLWEQGCDLYLASLPIDGARTRVDVLASGTPYLRHSWRQDGEVPGRDPARDPDGMLAWRTWEDLATTLGRVSDRVALTTLGAQARTVYERHHQPEVFTARLSAILEGRGSRDPEEPEHDLDPAGHWVLRRHVEGSPQRVKRNFEVESRFEALTRRLTECERLIETRFAAVDATLGDRGSALTALEERVRAVEADAVATGAALERVQRVTERLETERAGWSLSGGLRGRFWRWLLHGGIRDS